MLGSFVKQNNNTSMTTQVKKNKEMASSIELNKMLLNFNY